MAKKSLMYKKTVALLCKQLHTGAAISLQQEQSGSIAKWKCWDSSQLHTVSVCAKQQTTALCIAAALEACMAMAFFVCHV